MSLFDRFRVKPVENDSAVLRQKLVDYILKALTDKDNRIRVEDVICTAATIVGERCIDAAGDFDLRNHNLHPGSRVFSDKANQLFCGDISSDNLDEVPADSIVGVLRSRLDPQAYRKEHFPVLSDVFKGYAARIGDPKEWGKVPLSVPEGNFPFVLPLRIGYETRSRVDEILAPIQADRKKCLHIATEALADILNKVTKVISPNVALLLTIEMINGMMKTAPMTAKALAQAQQ